MTRFAVRVVRRETVWPGMESLTCCQNNKPRLEVRIVRRDTIEPGTQSLTSCKVGSRIKFEVRKVRRDITGPDCMKSLTNCQANITRLAVRTVRNTWLSLAWIHPLPVKSM